MTNDPRRRTLTPPRSPWEATLEEESGVPDHSQAGEIEPGSEPGGGGDKGIDAATGGGGYGGDAVIDGVTEAGSQPDRPVDREIPGEDLPTRDDEHD